MFGALLDDKSNKIHRIVDLFYLRQGLSTLPSNWRVSCFSHQVLGFIDICFMFN